MHETSPGQVEKHELSIRSISDNKSELNGAETKTNIVMEETTMKKENIDEDDELNQRIYDDPCDLLDDVPIYRMQRSRSWFCCPSSDAANQPNSIFYNRCPDYSLVTEAPKIQYHTVGLPLRVNMKQIEFSSIIFRRPHVRPPTGSNWIYDIIASELNMCFFFSSIFRSKR